MALSRPLRQFVANRANGRCEYCRLHQDYSVKKHEVDHIIPKKHGGSNARENLAWTCFHCNRYKGSEVGAFDRQTGQLVPLFNPRTQTWDDHFLLDAGRIIPRTDVGRVTVLVLQLNRPARIQLRKLLAETRFYP